MKKDDIKRELFLLRLKTAEYEYNTLRCYDRESNVGKRLLEEIKLLREYLALCLPSIDCGREYVEQQAFPTQAGDKIVESEYPDYVCIIPIDMYDIQLGNIFYYVKGLGYQNISNDNNHVYLPKFFGVEYKDHFKIHEPNKETIFVDFISVPRPPADRWDPESNPDYEVIEDYQGLKKGDILTYSCYSEKHKDTLYWYRNIGKGVLLSSIKQYPKIFKAVVKKETPLSDLNTEVQREQEEQEKYTKLANELVEVFMPLVNGWERLEKNESTFWKAGSYWSYSSPNKRKAAIMCASEHCKLMLNDKKLAFPHWLQEMNLIYLQLQKMLSE